MSYYPPGPPPPGYAPVPPLPPPMLKRTRGLGVWIVVLTSLTMLLMVFESLLVGGAAKFAEDTQGLAHPGVSGVDYVFSLSLLALWSIFIATAVLTMVWLHALQANARVVTPHAVHARSAVWAVLGWLVPFVALWFPLQVVRDVRHAFEKEKVKRALPAQIGLLVGFWWAFFLLMVLVYFVAASNFGQIDMGTSTAGRATTLYQTAVVLTVLAGGLWIAVVLTTERRQAGRIAQVAPALAEAAQQAMPAMPLGYPPYQTHPGYPGYPPAPPAPLTPPEPPAQP